MKHPAKNAAPAPIPEPPFTEAISERVVTATGYPVRTPANGARLAVEIRAPGEHGGSVLISVKQSDGPGASAHNSLDLFPHDVELFIAVLEHALREARATGTFDANTAPAA